MIEESFEKSHAEHVERYACAFLKQMGTDKASRFVLVDRRKTDKATGDLIMTLSFEPREEHQECRQEMDEPHPGMEFSCL